MKNQMTFEEYYLKAYGFTLEDLESEQKVSEKCPRCHINRNKEFLDRYKACKAAWYASIENNYDLG
jgi:hypothetical protein